MLYGRHRAGLITGLNIILEGPTKTDHGLPQLMALKRGSLGMSQPYQ